MAVLTPTVVKTDCQVVPVYMRFDGNEPGSAVQMRIACCNGKEPWTCQFIAQLPRPSVLVDIGANVGSYTIMAAKLGHVVIAIEPGYANYHHLMRNVILNEVEERVIALPLALSDRMGMDWLHFGELGAGAASHAMGQPVPGNVPMRFHRQLVQVAPLDRLLADYGLPKPAFLKLDVDGHESRVVAGMLETLKTVQAAIVESKDEYEASIVKTFADAGMVRKGRFAERNGQPIKGLAYHFFERPQPEQAEQPAEA